MCYTKKLLTLVILIALMLTIVGCSEFSASWIQIDLENGDKFNIKMQSDNACYRMNFNEFKDGRLMIFEDHYKEESIFDDDDYDKSTFDSGDILVLEGVFLTESLMEDYIDKVITGMENGLIKIKDSGEDNGVKYHLITFKNSNNDRVYEIVGWIIGSNTGIVLDGYDSDDELINTFNMLTFDIKTTNQKDPEYCFKDIDDFKDLMD